MPQSVRRVPTHAVAHELHYLALWHHVHLLKQLLAAAQAAEVVAFGEARGKRWQMRDSRRFCHNLVAPARGMRCVRKLRTVKEAVTRYGSLAELSLRQVGAGSCSKLEDNGGREGLAQHCTEDCRRG